MLQCSNNGGDKWRMGARDALLALECHHSSNPVTRATACYVSGNIDNPVTRRRLWTSNWNEDMIREYEKSLPQYEVRQVSSALLQCGRILSTAIGHIFEERKIFLRDVTYRAMCVLPGELRSHDHSHKLTQARNRMAALYEQKQQRRQNFKQERYASTFYHNTPIVVSYDTLQRDLDRTSMTNHRRRLSKLSITPDQRARNKRGMADLRFDCLNYGRLGRRTSPFDIPRDGG